MILCWSLAVLAGFAQPGEYQWPLDLPREITSSFGEFREGRFHAGIDLRTGGPQPVHAVAEGYVSRIRCGPSGYGKAIYLKLGDGRTVVYGHLSEYCAQLRDYVRAAQHARETYTVDLTPQPRQFVFHRGEVLGVSGRTGTYAHHLHLELREPEDQPINPYYAGFVWQDGTLPEVQRIVLAPRNAQARINGGCEPVVLPAKMLGPGRYETPPVDCAGEIGVGVDLIDPAPGGSKLGVQEVVLRRGGEEVFRVLHDRIRYQDMGAGAVAYHPLLMQQGRFLLLWRWPGNTCGFYQHSPGNGWADAGTGGAALAAGQDDSFSIEITDVANNRARVRVPLAAGHAAPPAAPSRTTATQGRWQPHFFGQAVVYEINFDGAEQETPKIKISGPDAEEEIEAFRKNDSEFQSAWAPAAQGMYAIAVLHPRVDPSSRSLGCALGSAPLHADFGEVSVDVPAGATFGPPPLAVEECAPPKTVLKAYGKAYRCWPEDAPLAAPVSLELPLPAGVVDDAKVQVYRANGGSWEALPTAVAGIRLRAKTVRLGVFQVMEDVRPPVVKNVVPEDGYRARTRRPKIQARVADAGSGIASIRVTCAGKWLLMAEDPIRKSIEWERDQDLPPGPQEIRFHLTDAAGNETSVTRAVVIR